MTLKESATTVGLLRSSYFPKELSQRVIRHALRFASIAGILFVSSWVEAGGNFIAFLLAWAGLLALNSTESRSLSMGPRTMFWPGSRAQRVLAGITAVEILPAVLLFVLPFIVNTSPLRVLTAGILLLMQNLILMGHETMLANGHSEVERFLRDGGFSLLAPAVIASTIIPLKDAAPTDTIVMSTCIVAVISSEIGFARNLTSFKPGFFIPNQLKNEVTRFGRKHAAFAFGGGVVASLLTGEHPAVAAAVGVSVGVGAYFLHGLMFLTRGVGRLGIAFLMLVLTSALGGVAASILLHPPFTVPLMAVASLLMAAAPFFGLRALNDERIIRNS